MRRRIYDYFLLLVLGFVSYGVLKLLSPCAGALLAALMCAVTFYPMYQALHRWFPKMRASVRAAIANTLVFIFFVTPILLLAWAIIGESTSLIPVLKQASTTIGQWHDGNFMDSAPWMTHVHYFVANAFGMKRALFQENVINGVDKTMEFLSLSGTLLAKNALQFLVDLMIMLFALFFMFHDGEKFTQYLFALMPIRSKDKEHLSARIHDTVIGIARGLFLTSLVQGVVSTIGYLIVGVHGSVLLGALTAVMGLLPVVGTFGIWVPTGIFFLIQGSYLKGTFLLLWGMFVVVGLVDTLIRPYLVGKKAQLPMYALFFALLGGVEVWGTKGIILGPLIVAIAPVLLDMYQQRYLRGFDVIEQNYKTAAEE